jgi:hypothetical protein
VWNHYIFRVTVLPEILCFLSLFLMCLQYFLTPSWRSLKKIDVKSMLRSDWFIRFDLTSLLIPLLRRSTLIFQNVSPKFYRFTFNSTPVNIPIDTFFSSHHKIFEWFFQSYIRVNRFLSIRFIIITGDFVQTYSLISCWCVKPTSLKYAINFFCQNAGTWITFLILSNV